MVAQARTSLFSRKKSGGIYTIEDCGLTTGARFFADSNGGSSSNGGSGPDDAVATLAAAVALCTASKGDRIYLMPGHAETGGAAAISASVAGIQIIGLGTGRLKPAFTCSTNAVDCMSIDAANIYMENVRFIGAASGATGLLTIGAADFTGNKLVFEHGAAPTVGVNVSTSSHRFLLQDCMWRGTAAGPATSIKFNGKTDDWHIVNAHADYGGSAGLDGEFLFSSFKMKGYTIENLTLVSFDAEVIDINSSSAACGDGVLIGGGSVATAGITIANAHDVGGCAIIDHKVTDSVAARGLVVPVATPN